MGERGEITVTEEDSEGIELAIKGDGSGLLIGRHGQTLDSLEYLVNRILARRVKDAVPITVDTESYRERRRRQLHRMALSMAEQTKREHASVTLDPMPPRDRRIVHLALKDDPLITTRSTGDGFLRVVEIIPVGERRESGGARGRRAGREAAGVVVGRNREREREPEPQRERGSAGRPAGRLQARPETDVLVLVRIPSRPVLEEEVSIQSARRKCPNSFGKPPYKAYVSLDGGSCAG